MTDARRYRALFVTEARRTLADVSTELSRTRPDPGRLMRQFHTLKGMAATMQLAPIVATAHAVEDLLEQARLGFLTLDPTALDLVRSSTARVATAIDAVEADEEPADAEILAERIRSFVVANTRTEFRLLPTDAPSTRPQEAPGPGATFAQLMGAVERLRARAGDHAATRAELDTVEAAARALHSELCGLREVPFATVVGPLRLRLATLAEDRGIGANLEVIGDQVRVDPAVLGPLQAALVHLLQNAVAHGLEPAEERGAKGPVGRVLVAVERRGGLLRASLTDDGRGLVASELRRVADDPDADPAEIARRPGLSTASGADSTAGRGQGLAAVEQLVASVGGRMDVYSTPGEGTTVTLEVPLPGDAPAPRSPSLTNPFVYSVPPSKERP